MRRRFPYWQQAGQRASQRSANSEAGNHLTKGIELLKTLPHMPNLIQQELVLQTTLGAVLMAARGYAAPEAGQAYARARELCQQIGATPQLGPVLHGLWGFYVTRAEHRTAYELGEQLLTLAKSQHDTIYLLEARWMLGASLFHLGELSAARAHFEQGLALYNLQEHRHLAFVYGHDPGMSSLCLAAVTLWHLGYPEQALKSSQLAVSLAREVAHPFSLIYALNFAAWCHQFRREEQKAKEQAEAGMVLSIEHGVPLFLAQNTILRGWVLAEQGHGGEGLAQMHQGSADCQATGMEIWRPSFLALLAETYGKVGQAEEGLTAVSVALALVDKTGERVWEAELYRLRGELTLAQSHVQRLESSIQKKAEECFLKAIEIAQKQQAKSLELRAVMSLSRLWQSQGKKTEAHQMLVDIYDWFTEGFDTKDLQEAQKLLEESV